ncbi:MAG: cytochrome b/b6 domain-containing protein, partial [Alphaproteobacteria bacterium]|nr:cytochrome b/b6 domain-containing protein [Alphaproteobacteria bacterium]
MRVVETERVVRHHLLDRLYHWTMAATVLTLLGTGFLPILGWKFEWVTAHWIAGLVLAALVAWHILRASVWLDFWSMVVDYDDVRNGWRAIGQAFGRKGPPPRKPGKYSLLQKLYHVAIACVVLALVVTGVLMLLKIDTPLWRRNPYWFSDQAWGVIYLIHDLGAMSVITLLMAHVDFALRPEKLWMSWSMIRGWISQADYRTHHDP